VKRVSRRILTRGASHLETTPERNKEKDLLGHVAVDSVKVRCPKCYQPYKIFASDIREARPKFQCKSCDSRFWLPFPEALNRSEQIGFPVSWLGVKAEDTQHQEKLFTADEGLDKPFEKTCSNCEKRHAIHLKECPHCGVVAEKAENFEKFQIEGVQSTAKMRKLWKGIHENFEDEDGHLEFVLEAEKEKCLEYATRRYAEIEEAIGPDPLVEKLKTRIAALSGGLTEIKPRVKPATKTPVEPTRRTWIRFSNLILLIAVVVCTVGLSIPGGQNMVGVGAAIAFFSLALRMLRR